MSQDALNTAIKKGFPAPCYLFHAEDSFPLKEAVAAVRSLVPEEERDYLFHAFDFEAPLDKVPPVGRVLDILNMVSLMGGRKVVVMEGLQKADAKTLDPLAAYISAPNKDALLVMTYTGEMKKGHKDVLGPVIKPVALDIRERDLPVWVEHRARERGIKITPDAVQYLILTVGADVGLLASEVEKLSLCGTPTVDVADVTALVKGDGDADSFDLTRALGSGNARKVFEVYAQVAKSTEPIMVLGALNWYYGSPQCTLSQEKKKEVYDLLKDADYLVKSTGGLYPLELTLMQLVRLSGRR